MIVELTHRKQDDWGSGEYGASRGERIHKGIDYAFEIKPMTPGEVSKVGYPYADDKSYRYVEITDKDGYRWRYFYISPQVKKGQRVTRQTVLGTVQDLGKRYPGITPHIHLEVIKDGKYLNPEDI